MTVKSAFEPVLSRINAGLNLRCRREVQFKKFSKNADGKDKGRERETGCKL